MEILDHVHGLLERDGYTVRRVSGQNGLEFEDGSLFGAVWIFPSVQDLLDHWRRAQSGFLRRYQAGFQKLRDKSWNAYAVLLTGADADPDSWARLSDVEEDFHGARKIVGTGIQTRSDIQRALRPLLRLQSRAVLDAAPALERLSSIDSISAEVKKKLLTGGTAEELARIFLEHDG